MNERGMTLLEIMAVVVIIGLISAIAGPWIFSASEAAKVKITKSMCQKYHGGAHQWRMIHGSFPRTLDELEQPLDPGSENFMSIQNDPWDSPFRMEIDDRKVRIWSNGPDREEGTPDDICYVPVDGS